MAVPAWLVQSYCTFDSAQIAQALDWTLLNMSGQDLQDAYGFALWYRPAMNRDNQLRVDRLAIKLQQEGRSAHMLPPPANASLPVGMNGAPSMGGFWDSVGSFFGGGDDSQADADALAAQWAREDAAMVQQGQQWDASWDTPPASGGGGGGGTNWTNILNPLIGAAGQIGAAAIYAANVPQATPYMPPNMMAPPNAYSPYPPQYPYAPQAGMRINPQTGMPYPAGTQINPQTGLPLPAGQMINPQTGMPMFRPTMMPLTSQMPSWLLPAALVGGLGLAAYAMSR